MRRLVLCALLVALGGCGWSSQRVPAAPEQAVRDAIHEYRDAVLKVDRARVCAVFSAAARRAMDETIGHPCAEDGATLISFATPEQVHVHLWHIRSVVVRGDRATVRFAPVPHLKERRQALVREPGGWKLERFASSYNEQAPWEHCVFKLVYEIGENPAAVGLVGDTAFDYSERWCTDMQRLPEYPSRADYDWLEDTILEGLVDEDKLTADQAGRFRNR
jgi:hypothetical protein